MPNIFGFLKEVREELDKVVWPTREQTLRYTILVVLVALAVGAFLGGLDYILTILQAAIIERIPG
ncbi:MAG: preprotein translocase subunit SecE [Candidatus Daviesbacteria bacterium]|nr:preprotein translocase subunit SecE [Candidatus Daviesbacteria bacterium]